MHIAMLTQYFWPEDNFRTTALAEGLRDRGHQISVVTGFPNWPHGRLHEGYKMRPWKRETHEGIEILRVPLFPDHSNSTIRRGLNYGSFALSASTIGSALCRSADLLYVYHPPLTMGLPGVIMSKLRGMPLVYNVMDLWPESLVATGMRLPNLAMSALRRSERWIYSQAKSVVVLSNGFKRNLIAKGVPAEKVDVITVWGDESVYQPMDRDPEFAAAHGLKGKFNVMYAGNMGEAQALETVVETATLLRDLQDIQFVFVGDGVSEAKLRAMAEQRKLTNVRFLGRQPSTEMAKFLSCGDALLVHLRKDPLFEITIPSKTTAYMACGRPVIVALRGDAADIIEEHGAGRTCESESPEALAQTVREMFALPPEDLQKMADSARSAFLTKYSKQALIGKYNELFNRIVAN